MLFEEEKFFCSVSPFTAADLLKYKTVISECFKIYFDYVAALTEIIIAFAI